MLGEYTAEGAIAPIVMIRRGTMKFIHSPGDPDQLFDLAYDRDELNNLCDNPELQDVVTAFRAEVAARWDIAELHEQVLESQRNRRFISQSLRKGTYTSWEFTPPRDSSTEYMRNHLDLNDVERLARWPR